MTEEAYGSGRKFQGVEIGVWRCRDLGLRVQSQGA